MVAVSQRVVHTAHLHAGELVQIRDLLDGAFAGRFTDADWSHTVGGLHVLLAEDDQIVAHAAVVQRQFLHDDRPIRTGYVEGVAVEAGHRGRGYAARVMDEAERIICAAYDLGALSAADGVDAFYRSRGWLSWQGPTAVLSPTGISRTPDDDESTFVLLVPSTAQQPMQRTGLLACDWRDGDVW